MLSSVRTEPKICPSCSSTNVGEHAIDLAKNVFICHTCGRLILVQRDYDEEEVGEELILPAGFLVCPHCRSVNQIQIHGDVEWCKRCFLDPSQEEYPSSALAHLWKEGSGIQKLLKKNVGLARPNTAVGKFLRKYCGPHCQYARNSQCPQEMKNLITCWSEERGFEVIRKSSSKADKRVRRRQLKERQKALQRLENIVKEEPQRALFRCAKAGWFEKVLHATSPNPQQTGNTRSGSGA